MNTPEKRRAHWQKSVDHKSANGLLVDRDPVFLAWIEEWIAGNISMQEVQERYAVRLMSRDKKGLHGDDNTTGSLMDDLRGEVPAVANLQSGTPVDRSNTTQGVETAWGDDEQGMRTRD